MLGSEDDATPPPDQRTTETQIDARTTPIGRGRVPRLVFGYRPRVRSSLIDRSRAIYERAI